MPLNRLQALVILSECTGDEIWSVEHCRLRKIPETWVDELADSFESGFRRDSETIYVDDAVVNQYRGVRDVDLAIRIAEYLGVEVDALCQSNSTRASLVAAIKEAIEES